VPVYSGASTDDYTAVSLGAGFSRDEVAFTSRVETRMGDLDDQWSFSLGALRERDATSYAGHLELWRSDRSGPTPVSEDILSTRFSLAYRPLDTRWILLEQVQFEHGLSDGGGFDTRGNRVLNHLKLNWNWNERTQIAWQYSAKWVAETIDGERYDSLGHLFGVEARYDVMPGWDIGLHARARQLAFGDTSDGNYSVGASVGRLVTKNVWASVGYNVEGFSDADFSQSEYTAEGPYVRLRLKVDQDSVREWLDWSPTLASRVKRVLAARE